MNREDVIRMAREVWPDGEVYIDDQLVRFAYNIAAAEREACAKVCQVHGSMARYAVWVAEECATLIRMRGKP